MQKQTHKIKSFKVLNYSKTNYSKLQLWICKKFKITPAYEYKVEVRFDLDSFERMFYGDVIKLNNGITFKVTDKCITPNWIIAESDSIIGFRKHEFKPAFFTIEGTSINF
jgi:hypothetical protein